MKRVLVIALVVGFLAVASHAQKPEIECAEIYSLLRCMQISTERRTPLPDWLELTSGVFFKTNADPNSTLPLFMSEIGINRDFGEAGLRLALVQLRELDPKRFDHIFSQEHLRIDLIHKAGQAPQYAPREDTGKEKN